MSSTLPDTSVMSYNFADGATATHSEVQDYHKQVDQLKYQVKEQQEELSQMKSEVEKRNKIDVQKTCFKGCNKYPKESSK